MWLKLDTGMVLMLLLFRVLIRGKQSRSAATQQEVTREGGTGLLSDKHADSHTQIHDGAQRLCPPRSAAQSCPQGSPRVGPVANRQLPQTAGTQSKDRARPPTGLSQFGSQGGGSQGETGQHSCLRCHKVLEDTDTSLDLK